MRLESTVHVRVCYTFNNSYHLTAVHYIHTYSAEWELRSLSLLLPLSVFGTCAIRARVRTRSEKVYIHSWIHPSAPRKKSYGVLKQLAVSQAVIALCLSRGGEVHPFAKMCTWRKKVRPATQVLCQHYVGQWTVNLQIRDRDDRGERKTRDILGFPLSKVSIWAYIQISF